MSRKLPVVVVGYNRANSMKRLLESLNEAEYRENDVPLIISIDKADNNQDVLSVANSFKWIHGEKKVVYQKENLKLRKHILQCGDYALQYGNVIILEDDLLVSKYYYIYAEQALIFSETDDRIAGVSLYNHRYNVEASEPFEPLDDGYDNWYFQFASSWGEAWTKAQWKAFKIWYEQKPEIRNRDEIPLYVRKWPESSWLKFFISYVIEKNKYFIYPKKSLTTNFGDAGTHVNIDNTNYQVPLQNAKEDYIFSTIEESKSIYDAFFENVFVRNCFEQQGINMGIDLYGKKANGYLIRKYDRVITRKILNNKILETYGCCMRPHEENILRKVPGCDFFMYDLSVKEENSYRIDDVRKQQYNLRYIDVHQYKSVIKMFARKTIAGLARRMKK